MTWMSMRLLVWWPRGSRLTRVPRLEAWACPIMRSVPSCRATRHDFLCRQTSGWPTKFASPQLVQWASRSPARVRSCRAATTSKSVRRKEGWNGMVMSQTMPSLEYASAMALAGCGVNEPSSASLLTAKIFWRRSRWVVIWVLAGRASGITKGARGEVCRPRLAC